MPQAGLGGANLASLTPNADTNSNKDYKDLNGLLLRRVTSQVQAASGKGTVHKYDYHLENQRDYRVRVVIECTGANVKVNAGPGGVQKTTLIVEQIVDRGATILGASVTAADGEGDFSFSSDIKIYPATDEDVRIADLDGVKLFTTVTYDNLVTVMKFEAENTRAFDVEVVLDLKGQLVHQSGFMPFTKLVRSNDKIVIGHAKSDREIESSWKWRQVNKEQAGQPSSTPKATPAQPPASLPKQPSLSAVGGSLADKIVQTSVLKGVTLKQSISKRKKEEDPSVIEFEVLNSLEKDISVSIDVETENGGTVSFRNQARPLVGDVLAKQLAFLGVVEIKGEAYVNWKFREH